jgi:uncharacterized protein YtpQ (UPF0354 family)
MNKSKLASLFGARRLLHICFLALALHGVGAFADSFTDRVTAAFNQKDPKLQATIGADSARMFVSRPYISGAVLLYAIDTPRAIRFVNASDLEHSGLTLDALDKIALSHVSRLAPLTFSQMNGAPGLWAGIASDGYGTSRLFDPKFGDTLEARAGGPVAVALPTRDWLLAARLDNPQAIAKLRAVAARIVAGEPTAVTSALVRRNGQSWTEVPP